MNTGLRTSQFEHFGSLIDRSLYSQPSKLERARKTSSPGVSKVVLTCTANFAQPARITGVQQPGCRHTAFETGATAESSMSCDTLTVDPLTDIKRGSQMPRPA